MTRTQVARPRGHGRQSKVAGFEPAVAPPRGLSRLLVGVDPPEGAPVQAPQLDALNDPLAALLFKRDTFPRTVTELLAELDNLNTDPLGLPVHKSFLVGEGSQIAWGPGSDEVRREMRFAITRGRKDDSLPDVMISTSATGDEEESFLQLLAWDEPAGVFNYYLRLEGTDAWLWVGNSNHALEAATRGKGPFDAHVNGSVVMKELRIPWINWHSSLAGVHVAIDPAGQLESSMLNKNKSTADTMEKVVRAGISRWTQARIKKIKAAGTVEHPKWLLRQLFETTTVNLASTQTVSTQVGANRGLTLPITFFFDRDGLQTQSVPIPPILPALNDGPLYAEAVAALGLHLDDRNGFVQQGDTHFAFLVPERAAEDVSVVAQMSLKRLLSQKLVAAALMVDFQNPVYSPRRAQLMKHVPASATVTDTGSDLGDQIVKSIEAAAASQAAGSPEHEFLATWNLPDTSWKQDVSQRIRVYMESIVARLNTPDGFLDYMRLAESRRREFGATHLAEFALLLPLTNVPANAAPLEMAPDGTVRDRIDPKIP